MPDETIESVVAHMQRGLSNEPQPSEGRNEGPAQGDSTDGLDFGDMPNGQIRYDKAKKQLQQERTERLELEKQVARLEGKMEATQPGKEKEDPTEYMSDSEKFLYQQNLAMKDAMEKILPVINNLSKSNTMTGLEKSENIFFEDNPQLKARKPEVIQEVAEFLTENPQFKSMLSAKQISFDQLWGAVQATNKSTKRVTTDDPGNYFSGNRSKPSSRSVVAQEDNLAAAMKTITDPKADNKAEAMDYAMAENVKWLQDRLY
tara:strand:- start:489 stop:1268 length:780 start_codon:yes stop_codon:yes gene_type:complete